MMTVPSIPTVDIHEVSTNLWGTDLQPAGCDRCGQAYLVPMNSSNQICPGCMTGKLTPQPALLRSEPPELLIPYQINSTKLKQQLDTFTSGIWLHSDDFTTENLYQRLRPVFIPMWLTDCNLEGFWKAEMGFDYQVASALDSYVNGDWKSQERIETRVRWEPRVGQIKRHYDNIATPAVTNFANMTYLAGNFNLEKAEDFRHDRLGKASMRIPDLNPENAWPMTQENIKKAAGFDIQNACKAQHTRDLDITTTYSDLQWTQLLLPIYISYYSGDHDEPHLVYINGQTGKIGGPRLSSQRKGWHFAFIIALIAIMSLLIGVILSALIPVSAIFGVIGSVLILIGCLGLCGAIVPAVWPWQWNRQQTQPKVTAK